MNALLLDLGNTRWKMARAMGADIGSVVSGSYDDVAGLLTAAQTPGDSPQMALVASVVDTQTTDRVIDVLARDIRLRVTRIRSTDPMPNLVAGYRRPEQLGVDRLLAMVAVRARSEQPFCVVDAGTAVTVDFVDPRGQHLGGFILPGIRMSRDCLLRNTSIPRDDQIDEQALLGRDTPTAVALGIRCAVAGLVERFTIGSAALFPRQEVQVFVGGGDAERFLGLLPKPCFKIDHLVLRGLAAVAASGDP